MSPCWIFNVFAIVPNFCCFSCSSSIISLSLLPLSSANAITLTISPKCKPCSRIALTFSTSISFIIFATRYPSCFLLSREVRCFSSNEDSTESLVIIVVTFSNFVANRFFTSLATFSSTMTSAILSCAFCKLAT